MIHATDMGVPRSGRSSPMPCRHVPSAAPSPRALKDDELIDGHGRTAYDPHRHPQNACESADIRSTRKAIGGSTMPHFPVLFRKSLWRSAGARPYGNGSLSTVEHEERERMHLQPGREVQ